MSRKHKIQSNQNLNQIFKDGEVVELFFLPIEKYRYKDDEVFPELDPSAVPLIVSGSCVGEIDFKNQHCICLKNIEKGPSDYVIIYLNQITHYRILKQSKITKANFGQRLRLSIDKNGKFHCNDVWIRDPELIVASLLNYFGYKYKGKKAKEYFSGDFVETEDLFISGYRLHVTDKGLKAGCVVASKEQLLDALDWCAEQFGWND